MLVNFRLKQVRKTLDIVQYTHFRRGLVVLTCLIIGQLEVFSANAACSSSVA